MFALRNASRPYLSRILNHPRLPQYRSSHHPVHGPATTKLLYRSDGTPRSKLLGAAILGVIATTAFYINEEHRQIQIEAEAHKTYYMLIRAQSLIDDYPDPTNVPEMLNYLRRWFDGPIHGGTRLANTIDGLEIMMKLSPELDAFVRQWFTEFHDMIRHPKLDTNNRTSDMLTSVLELMTKRQEVQNRFVEAMNSASRENADAYKIPG